MSHELILILDYGSQYTQLIARRIRELNVYCEIHPCTLPVDTIRAMNPKGIVLSGGPASTLDEGAPTAEDALWKLGVPMLGICYGMQLAALGHGGSVSHAERREYGPATVHIDRNAPLFAGIDGDDIAVWASHGDRVETLPDGFQAVGSSENCPIAAYSGPGGIYGIQFHPEVSHTPQGGKIIANFLFDICNCAKDWTPGAFINETIEAIQHQVGEQGRVILGLSGGVDSSVTAVLLHKAIGKRLTCIFVDNGLLRLNEREEVEETFREHYSMDLITVDARERFYSKLKGLTDPEDKRKAIGHTFIDVFREEAEKIGGTQFLAQGTIYPDVIESTSFKGPSATIKSHHNVGGLPEQLGLELVEPLRELFKDEVRRVGAELGIPETMLMRHPFPGPGLGVRVLGEVTGERCDVLRLADAIFIGEIRKAGWYDRIAQAFAVLLPVKSVGVMGDERTHEHALVLRAVNTTDFMTANITRLPFELLETISNRIINEVRGINRVAYDVSSKPPATIEWE